MGLGIRVEGDSGVGNVYMFDHGVRVQGYRKASLYV